MISNHQTGEWRERQGEFFNTVILALEEEVR
jgi:hypothetical protein